MATDLKNFWVTIAIGLSLWGLSYLLLIKGWEAEIEDYKKEVALNRENKMMKKYYGEQGIGQRGMNLDDYKDRLRELKEEQERHLKTYAVAVTPPDDGRFSLRDDIQLGRQFMDKRTSIGEHLQRRAGERNEGGRYLDMSMVLQDESILGIEQKVPPTQEVPDKITFMETCFRIAVKVINAHDSKAVFPRKVYRLSRVAPAKEAGTTAPGGRPFARTFAVTCDAEMDVRGAVWLLYSLTNGKNRTGMDRDLYPVQAMHIRPSGDVRYDRLLVTVRMNRLVIPDDKSSLKSPVLPAVKRPASRRETLKDLLKGAKRY